MSSQRGHSYEYWNYYIIVSINCIAEQTLNELVGLMVYAGLFYFFILFLFLHVCCGQHSVCRCVWQFFFSTRCNDSRRYVSNQITSNWFFFIYILFHSPVCAKHTAHNHKRIHIIFIYARRDTWKCFNTILDDFLLCSFVFFVACEKCRGRQWNDLVNLVAMNLSSLNEIVCSFILFYYYLVASCNVCAWSVSSHSNNCLTHMIASSTMQRTSFFCFFIFIDACSLLLLRKKFID